ncbi:MAG TPA: FkbM family methyltransferase [Verrucomicrobiae bacterium]|jgi:FkbM family methyltransferase
MSYTQLKPVQCATSEASAYTPAGGSLLLRIACFWNKYGPRGKSAIPRILGRTFGKELKIYVMTESGARLAVNPPSLDFYAHVCNHGGAWNEHVLMTCASRLKKGQVFWDIGANAGIMSIDIAQRFQGDVHVLAFEPLPALSRIIAISAALNDFRNITAYDIMMGDQNGETNLYVGSHAIHASAKPREQHCVEIVRRVITIDSLVRDEHISPPSLIKMDIEGGELCALSGARETISNHKPDIVFESDENMERFGYKRKDLLQLLSECADYEFYFIDNSGALIPVEGSNLSAQYSDILATVQKDR